MLPAHQPSAISDHQGDRRDSNSLTRRPQRRASTTSASVTISDPPGTSSALGGIRTRSLLFRRQPLVQSSCKGRQAGQDSNLGCICWRDADSPPSSRPNHIDDGSPQRRRERRENQKTSVSSASLRCKMCADGADLSRCYLRRPGVPRAERIFSRLFTGCAAAFERRPSKIHSAQWTRRVLNPLLCYEAARSPTPPHRPEQSPISNLPLPSAAGLHAKRRRASRLRRVS